MRRIALAIAAAGIVAGSLAGAQTATAASTSNNPAPAVPAVQAPLPSPVIQALDCAGFTGVEGCGPGWFWRDGWRGFGCYPC